MGNAFEGHPMMEDMFRDSSNHSDEYPDYHPALNPLTSYALPDDEINRGSPDIMEVNGDNSREGMAPEHAEEDEIQVKEEGLEDDTHDPSPPRVNSDSSPHLQQERNSPTDQQQYDNQEHNQVEEDAHEDIDPLSHDEPQDDDGMMDTSQGHLQTSPHGHIDTPMAESEGVNPAVTAN